MGLEARVPGVGPLDLVTRLSIYYATMSIPLIICNVVCDAWKKKKERDAPIIAALQSSLKENDWVISQRNQVRRRKRGD